MRVSEQYAHIILDLAKKRTNNKISSHCRPDVEKSRVYIALYHHCMFIYILRCSVYMYVDGITFVLANVKLARLAALAIPAIFYLLD